MSGLMRRALQEGSGRGGFGFEPVEDELLEAPAIFEAQVQEIETNQKAPDLALGVAVDSQHDGIGEDRGAWFLGGQIDTDVNLAPERNFLRRAAESTASADIDRLNRRLN